MKKLPGLMVQELMNLKVMDLRAPAVEALYYVKVYYVYVLMDTREMCLD